jgi:hypothetical protein
MWDLGSATRNQISSQGWFTEDVRRVLALTILAATLGVVAWLSWVVANPRTSTLPTGDAIFVHAGGNGERLGVALTLFEEGAAPLVVISDPGGRSSSVPAGLCESGPAVLCVTPSTIDTAGEARALGDLVESEGWNQVVVVTSDYHLSRAVLLDRSCTDAAIEPVAAPARPRRQPLVTWARVQETFGIGYSWLFQTC